jgi:hypothetical protein
MKWSFKVKYWRKGRYSAGPKVHGKVTSSPIWNEALRQRSKAIVITIVKPPALILESFFVPHSRWNRIFFSEHTSRTHHAVLKAHAQCIVHRTFASQMLIVQYWSNNLGHRFKTLPPHSRSSELRGARKWRLDDSVLLFGPSFFFAWHFF